MLRGEATLTTSMLRPIELQILKLIHEHKLSLNVSKIAKILGRDKGYVSRILNDLVRKGFLEVVSHYPKTFRLTSLGESCINTSGGGWGSVFRVDALQVFVRVVGFRGGWREFVSGWSGRRMGGGWWKYSTRFSGDVFVELNLGREPSVLIKFGRMWVSREEFLNGGFMGRVWSEVYKVYNWLLLNGIVLDLSTLRVVGHEFEAPIPKEFAGLLPDGVVRINLGRKARSIMGDELNQDAVAFIDSSLGYKEQGSNDAPYWYKFLYMPEGIWLINKSIKELDEKLVPAINNLTNQIKLHLEATKEWKDAAREIKRSFQERRPGLLEKIRSWFRRLRG